MVEKQYRVPDASCEHCVRAIRTELTAINGVQQVDVNLDTKIVTVRTAPSVSDEQILAGLDEAGYDAAAA